MLGRKHTFPSRSSDGNPVSGIEKLSLRDGVVYLGFKDSEEAVLAYLLSGLWTPQKRFRILAEGTALRRHRLCLPAGGPPLPRASRVKSSSRAGKPVRRD